MRLSVVQSNDFNGNESLEITINDSTKFYVSNNIFTPEENALSGNFADCFDIPELLRMAWEAGRKGEGFSIEHEREE